MTSVEKLDQVRNGNYSIILEALHKHLNFEDSEIELKVQPIINKATIKSNREFNLKLSNLLFTKGVKLKSATLDYTTFDLTQFLFYIN